jgi:hypothetical protein
MKRKLAVFIIVNTIYSAGLYSQSGWQMQPVFLWKVYRYAKYPAHFIESSLTVNIISILLYIISLHNNFDMAILPNQNCIYYATRDYQTDSRLPAIFQQQLLHPNSH